MCLDVAQREAERDGVSEAGGQHLLIGLFAAGLAANALAKLGATGLNRYRDLAFEDSNPINQCGTCRKVTGR